MHERPVGNVAAVLQNALVIGAPEKVALDPAKPAAVLYQVVEFGRTGIGGRSASGRSPRKTQMKPYFSRTG